MDFLQEPVGDSQKPITEIFQKFMIKLVTSPHSGVLRRSSGWYISEPQGESSAENEEREHFDTDLLEIYGKALKRPPIRNTVLADLAYALRPYASEPERELLLEMFKAAPELVADYWFRRINFSYEPKLTATWIGYSSLLFSAISLPIPEFFCQRNGFSSKPPPTSLAIEHIIPVPLNQKVLTTCILSRESPLIRLFAIRVLSIALQKLKGVLALYNEANDGATSQWWSRGRDGLVSMFIQRVPTMKDVIMVFRQHQNEAVLQREAIARLLSMYFDILPMVAMDEKFDISLALLKSLEKVASAGSSDHDSQMELLELSHLLKISLYSLNISWWKKAALAKYSTFLTVLRLYAQSQGDGSRISARYYSLSFTNTAFFSKIL